MPLSDLLPTLAGVALLIAAAAIVLRWAGVGGWWSPGFAVLRGGLQLAALSIVLTGVIADPLWVAAALTVMFAVAAVTGTRRVVWGWRSFGIIASGILAGVVLTMAVIFATGAIDFAPRYVLAMGGILIGNEMMVATLAARRVRESVDEHWGEVEGWFALGATPRQATSGFARRAIGEALIPSIDQTKTTGLVTLPGAFIGAIFGGLDPIEAGRFQVVVLASILCAAAVTSVIVGHGLAPVRQRPIPR